MNRHHPQPITKHHGYNFCSGWNFRSLFRKAVQKPNQSSFLMCERVKMHVNVTILSFSFVFSYNRVHPYSPRSNPVKFHQARIRFSRVRVFTSSEGSFTGNDVTDDVIMKNIRGFIFLPTKEQSCEVSLRSDKIQLSYCVYKRRERFYRK